MFNKENTAKEEETGLNSNSMLIFILLDSFEYNLQSDYKDQRKLFNQKSFDKKIKNMLPYIQINPKKNFIDSRGTNRNWQFELIFQKNQRKAQIKSC
jgi:hypothetical protein